jgi:hypothetical protein
MEKSIALATSDLQELEIETFQVESLDEIGVNAGAVTVNLYTTSSTTSSSCG